MGKDSTEVRSAQRALKPDNEGLDTLEPTSLRGIAKRASARKDHRFGNLYGEINGEMLRIAFGELNPKATEGIDGESYEDYKADLDARIDDLVERLKRKRYRAKLVRRVLIPKGNNQTRPLGIPALEDKIVQRAAAKLLSAIYEQDFIDTSYGYRPKRSAKGAIEDLTFNLQYGTYGYIVEADIKGFFDNLDHEWLIKMLEQRINDRAFINLIRKWLKAGILDTDGMVIHPETGTPQGGIISPVLANIYLHYALDQWFEQRVKKTCKGKAFISRYADDFVCGFQYQSEAKLFYQALPTRLKQFNLEVATEKTALHRFSRFSPSVNRQDSFIYLGFELWWGWSNKREPKVHRRTAPKKQRAAEKRVRDWIKKSRHLSREEFVGRLKTRLQGHYNYYGVQGNINGLYRFYDQALEQMFKWLNRRGGKRKSFTWKQFKRALPRLGFPVPCVKSWPHKFVVF